MSEPDRLNPPEARVHDNNSNDSIENHPDPPFPYRVLPPKKEAAFIGSPPLPSEEEVLSYGEEFPGVASTLGCPAQKMIDEIMRVEGVDNVLATTAVLGAYSAACGKGVEVNGLMGRRSRANLYLVVGVASGSGKSLTWKHAFDPLIQCEGALIDQWLHDALPLNEAKKIRIEEKIRKAKGGEDSNDEILAELIRDKREVERRLIPPQLIVEDFTSEALGIILQNSGEVTALLSSDGRSFVKNLLGRYTSAQQTDEDMLLKVYTGEPVRIHRVSRGPITLDSPCLAMYVAIQPDMLREMYENSSLRESGFLPRILPAPSEYKAKLIEPGQIDFDINVRQEYETHLQRVMERFLIPGESGQTTPITLKIAPAALEILRSYANECIALANGPLSDIAPFVFRWAENALRISLCIHVMHSNSNPEANRVISESEVNSGIRLQRWFAAKHLQMLSEGRDARYQEMFTRISGFLESLPGRERSLSELKKRNNIDENEVKRVVEHFPELIEIVDRPTGPKGGRPSKIVRLKGIEPIAI